MKRVKTERSSIKYGFLQNRARRAAGTGRVQRGRRRLFRYTGLFRRGSDDGRGTGSVGVHGGHHVDDDHEHYGEDDHPADDDDQHDGAEYEETVARDSDDELGETDGTAAAVRLVPDQFAGDDSCADSAAQRVPGQPEGTGTGTGAKGTECTPVPGTAAAATAAAATVAETLYRGQLPTAATLSVEGATTATAAVSAPATAPAAATSGAAVVRAVR